MRRRNALLAFLALGLAPIPTPAQQLGKVYRVGYLAGAAPPPDGSAPKPLRSALEELGYVDGKNVLYFGRWADGQLDRLGGLAHDLVRINVDVIVTLGGLAAEMAKKATSTVPIVVVGAGDVVATGLIGSLSRPGGNITGLSDDAATLSAKRMQILQEAVPRAKRIALLWNSDDYAMTLRYRAIDAAAQLLGVTVQALGVREPDDFEHAFSAMIKERPDALFLVADALTVLNRKRVIEFAEAHRIPAMYESALFVQSGGLMSYGTSQEDNFKVAARFLRRLFEGARPGDLPVEQPTRFYLAINLKTAKALGMSVPPGLLAQADTLVQ